jgi:hypothetical protein
MTWLSSIALLMVLFGRKLDGGTLKGANITVTSSTPHDEEHHDDNSKPIDQSDKPRAGSLSLLSLTSTKAELTCTL